MKLGEQWALRFDLKFKNITGMGKEGLRFEKGGDMLKDADGKGIEGRFLVDRTADGGWELSDRVDISRSPSTHELKQNFGVWKAGPLKRLFSKSINSKDVTPMSEIFNTPTVVDVLSTTGGLVVHSALSIIENASLSNYRTQYGDATMVAGGHVSSISSSSNYQYDDVGELAVDAIIKHEQKDFV